MIETLGNNPGLMILLLAAAGAALAWSRWRGLRHDWAAFRAWQAAGRPAAAALAAPALLPVSDLSTIPGAGAALAHPPADLAASLRYIATYYAEDPYTAPLGWSLIDGKAACVAASFVGDVNHILITGQTDSGKDNAALGIMLALAAQHGPRELQVCIVDGKGGLDWAGWENKAHCWGIAYDAENIAPMMGALAEERLRRTRILREAKAAKWDEYEGGDLPLLIVYVAELALLQGATSKSELAGWLNRELTSARALGIRYIIAAQTVSNLDTTWRGQIQLFMAGYQSASHADQPNTGLSTADLRALGTIPPSELPDRKTAAGVFTAVQGRDVATLRAGLLDKAQRQRLLGMLPDKPLQQRTAPNAHPPAQGNTVDPMLARLLAGEPLPFADDGAMAGSTGGSALVARFHADKALIGSTVAGGSSNQKTSVSSTLTALVLPVEEVPAEEQRAIIAAAQAARSRSQICQDLYGTRGGRSWEKVRLVCDAAGLLMPPVAPQAVAA